MTLDLVMSFSFVNGTLTNEMQTEDRKAIAHQSRLLLLLLGMLKQPNACHWTGASLPDTYGPLTCHPSWQPPYSQACERGHPGPSSPHPTCELYTATRLKPGETSRTTLLSPSQIAHPHNHQSIPNDCYFKSLSFGVVCYTKTPNGSR